ncbi:hypothetical protein CCH79_00017496 [Gambusia affinis]|uniref:LsmAD domain-containing protein n=1 Tax=Gambusia affinis TaxID=33528 RepID=A0A315V1K3_GAMAF|nr:hypothetical protein CCH79_00017496 [Gambusia affinis]
MCVCVCVCVANLNELSVALPVQLGSRPPHGGAFATIQDGEVNPRPVSSSTAEPIQSVYLPHQVTLTYAAQGRVAGQRACAEVGTEGLCPDSGRCSRCLGSCVAPTHHDDIIPLSGELAGSPGNQEQDALHWGQLLHQHSAARGLSQVSLPKGGVDRPQQVFSEKPEQFQPSEATDSNVKPLVCNGRASGAEVEATGQREESKSRRESVRSLCFAMLKPQQQSGSGGRKATNGTSGPGGMSSPVSGINSGGRTPAGRNRSSAKPSFQSSPVFEGVYNNARMLHFLTAVVGSTCELRVKNGSMFEGIFKTLSSRCELAVDAVHKRSEEEGSSSAPPRSEDITDTMIFSPTDLVTMICRDVDLNYATRDTFTDTAISSSRINGEHKEKVLQKWEGGDSNGESYDLENDAANGWDANEMFRYNEVKYGVTSTYDSSLSMYTVPLERGNSEVYRQREARAARLASEIESSPQYRHRVGLENDEGKSEEEKYSSVVRDGSDREKGRESPRDRGSEKGRDSPGASSREGKYIPLPQRQRELNRERAERGPGGPPPHGRLGGGYRPTPSSSSSPRPQLPSAAGPQPGVSPSERSSPQSSRVGAYAAHHTQGSPSPGSGPASPYTPASPGGSAATPTSASTATSPSSPPNPHGHPVPHSHSHPLSLSDAGRPVNGVSAGTSPKAQRPSQPSRTNRVANPLSQSTATRSPKPASSQDPPFVDVSVSAQKTSGPAPLFTVDGNGSRPAVVNEILGAAAKERSAESPGSTEDGKSSKAPSVQQRSQLEELRKFGKEFRLQPSGAGSSSPSSPAAAMPPSVGEVTQSGAAKPPSDTHPPSEPKPQPPAPSPSQTQPQHSPAPSEEPTKDATTPLGTAAATTAPIPDRQSPATPQPARTPGTEDARSETGERTDGVADQVKKSTLNPNAKEFNPNKTQMPMTKPNTAPTPPRPTPPSPVVLQHPGGQGPLYNTPYLSYVSQIHPVQHELIMYLDLRGLSNGVGPLLWPPSYGPAERDEAYKSFSLSGWAGRTGHDAPMIALDALLGAGSDWEELMNRAAFHGGDSDSTAVIAACCWGLLYGTNGIPEGNYSNLEYRDRLERCAEQLYALSH